LYLLYKGRLHLKAKVAEAGIENCLISEITLAELKYGVENSQSKEKNASALADFLTGVTIIPILPAFDIYAKEKARLRKLGQIIDDFDLLIGATAVANGLTLITNNLAHLERIEGIKIEDWSK
jgi:tRNA(fMet)-specific endonuclease VapC